MGYREGGIKCVGASRLMSGMYRWVLEIGAEFESVQRGPALALVDNNALAPHENAGQNFGRIRTPNSKAPTTRCYYILPILSTPPTSFDAP
jgi:hypothetical protein